VRAAGRRSRFPGPDTSGTSVWRGHACARRFRFAVTETFAVKVKSSGRQTPAAVVEGASRPGDTMEVPNGRGTIRPPAVRVSGMSIVRRIASVLEDVVLLMLGILLLPLLIRLIGAPIAFCIRVLLELVHRL
jgi:hypothetical protein